ncbi:MAG: type II secretion system protein [Anaeromyxobacter sp.]
MARRGFTLVELMVVMAVIGSAALLVVPAMASLTGANARRSAGELAGSMRALFEIAGLRHATCRLVLDLDKSTWRAECAQGRAGVSTDGKEDLVERFPDEKDEQVRAVLEKSKYGELGDRLVSKRELPGGARFGPVEVEGRQDPFEKGSAYVYFFPGGRAQAAKVPVIDGNFRYTVVLEPFTGRAAVVVGEVKP